MRIWLRPEERAPSPPPVPTDDRVAFLTGSVAWLVAALVLLVAGPAMPAGWLWTAVAGLALGLSGLAYSQLRRRSR